MAKPEKNKKENKHFFKDFKAELKKVIWPTSKQLINNTTAVLAIVLIVAAIVFVLDFAFKALNTYGINKLRVLVDTNNTTEELVNNTDNAVSTENSVNVENEESQEENTINEATNEVVEE